MVVSFIISSQGKDDRIFKTVSSIKRQTVGDYEVIIVNDDPKIEKESYDFLKDVFVEYEHVVLVNNSKSQGNSFNWNTGVQLANGDYVAFIKEGDVLTPDYVEAIQKIIHTSPSEIDLIQHQKKLTGLYNQKTMTSFLEENRLYTLPEDKEVYAYIGSSIYGKLFRTKYLRDFRIQFRDDVRYDTLFLYKVLGQAKTFYNSGENLLSNKISVLKYSSFDIANQWPHILNYYRRIGIYKDLTNELNYAQIYNMVMHFLLLIKRFGNQTLYRKALNFVNDKYGRRINEYAKDKEFMKMSKDDEFNDIIQNFSNYIRTELRKTR